VNLIQLIADVAHHNAVRMRHRNTSAFALTLHMIFPFALAESCSFAGRFLINLIDNGIKFTPEMWKYHRQ